MILRCKICGGDLELNERDKITTCKYCGTRQTLPKLDDEKRINLYNRANHFRRNNEYDKAMGIYELILNEDATDAEAYWSLILCKYGVEYVEDPATHKRVPTCNRTLQGSILADEDYKAAVRYADISAREIYEADAKTIEQIQRDILAISAGETAYDIFICYKESDVQGRRTKDSVLAQDIYEQLIKEGYRVFFSRVTLEDKSGTAYEPYIFSALSSARIMIVVGTKKEHFEAVWVRNEWSRFLSMTKSDADKILIPAYRDMDPYDLPDEMAHLQAQDMGRLGFIQDLVRGIKKIFPRTSGSSGRNSGSKEVAAVENVENLVKRIEAFLEEGDVGRANLYCEKVLDAKIDEPRAYLAKLQIEMFQKYADKELLIRDEALIKVSENIGKNPLFINALKYAVGNERERLLKLKSENREYCYMTFSAETEEEEEKDCTQLLSGIKTFLGEEDSDRWKEVWEKAAAKQRIYEEDSGHLAEIRKRKEELEREGQELNVQQKESAFYGAQQQYICMKKQYEETEGRISMNWKNVQIAEGDKKTASKVKVVIWAIWIVFFIIGIVDMSVSDSYYKGALLCPLFGLGLPIAILITAFQSKKTKLANEILDRNKRQLQGLQNQQRAQETKLKNLEQEKEKTEKAFISIRSKEGQLQKKIEEFTNREEELLERLKGNIQETAVPLGVEDTVLREGSIYEAQITELQDYGAVLQLSDGRPGFLHISQISDKRIRRVEEAVRVGMTVKAVYIGTDAHGRNLFSTKESKQV